MSSVFMLLSVVSCLKTPDEEQKKQIIIPDENFTTNTQDIALPFAVKIHFSNERTTVYNPFEGRGITVNVNRQHVTIASTITDTEVNYVLSGNTNDGSVKIYGDYRIGLILNGVSIQNPKVKSPIILLFSKYLFY